MLPDGTRKVDAELFAGGPGVVGGLDAMDLAAVALAQLLERDAEGAARLEDADPTSRGERFEKASLKVLPEARYKGDFGLRVFSGLCNR